MNKEAIFGIHTPREFEETALRIFRFQYDDNPVYREFCTLLQRTPTEVTTLSDIPFLPVEFFKTHRVITGYSPVEGVFASSGTTGSTPAKHYVTDLSYYRKSYLDGFRYFYGADETYRILALLPSYLERKDASLVYMVKGLMDNAAAPGSGFYLTNTEALKKDLAAFEAKGLPVLLIGVSFALLDLAKSHSFRLKHTIIMETGGMKGRRRELIREELHRELCRGFGVEKIHSEYGMTELLSQAYSKGDGLFRCPPWMKVLSREPEDPLQGQLYGKTGGLNIIDLANVNSCAFIATRDMGKVYEDGRFEVLGRFDHSEVRGCNLMVG